MKNPMELRKKAEIIAQHHQRLQSEWRRYCRTLDQAVSLSQSDYYLMAELVADDALHFRLYDHFIIRIAMMDDFNSHVIEYSLYERGGNESIVLATATLSEEGCLDGWVSNKDREAVLDHYLSKLEPLYDYLYSSIHNNKPVPMPSSQQLRSGNVHNVN